MLAVVISNLVQHLSYQVRLNSCHCDRREAIAEFAGIREIASFHCVPLAMTNHS